MALLLRDIVGLSYTEIADSLEITLATVKWRIYKAREEVRRSWLATGSPACVDGRQSDSADRGRCGLAGPGADPLLVATPKPRTRASRARCAAAGSPRGVASRRRHPLVLSREPERPAGRLWTRHRPGCEPRRWLPVERSRRPYDAPD